MPFWRRKFFAAVILMTCPVLSAAVSAQAPRPVGVQAQTPPLPPSVSIAGCNLNIPANATLLRQMDLESQNLICKVAPAVVQVIASGISFTPGQDLESATSTKEANYGSGVILSADGYIITNAHVVQNASIIRVILRVVNQTFGSVPEQRAPATLVGIDTQTDLALLKVDLAKPLPYLEFAPGLFPVRQGQFVWAFGNPRNLPNSVSMGIVSSPNRTVEDRDTTTYIQTDATINPGNSGGALVDIQGRLVGINTFILTESGGSEGLGFAIPAPVALHIYTDLKEHGKVHRGVIGVVTESLTDDLVEALKIPVQTGVLIDDVIKGHAAEMAGLKSGDVVVSANDIKVYSELGLDYVIYSLFQGDKLKLDVLRQGKPMTFEIVAEEQHTDPVDTAGLSDLTPEKNFVEPLGAFVVPLNFQLALDIGLREGTGVLVALSARTMASQSIDLHVGDAIHEINGKVITSSVQDVRDTIAAIKPGEAVVLKIERGGAFQYPRFRKH
jgi:serine protease Do